MHIRQRTVSGDDLQYSYQNQPPQTFPTVRSLSILERVLREDKDTTLGSAAFGHRVGRLKSARVKWTRSLKLPIGTILSGNTLSKSLLGFFRLILSFLPLGSQNRQFSIS